MSSADDRNSVTAWLSKHDMNLFADRVPVKVARKMCEKDLGRKVGGRYFKACREVCEFWKTLPSRQFSTQYALTWRQWDRFRQWSISNKTLLSSAPSIKFVARAMRADGIIASPELLANSGSFMTLWNGRHPVAEDNSQQKGDSNA